MLLLLFVLQQESAEKVAKGESLYYNYTATAEKTQTAAASSEQAGEEMATYSHLQGFQEPKVYKATTNI